MIFQSDRRFKLWDYNVTHQQLLIRSPQSSEVSDNIDMIFWGVRFIEIPTSMLGVELEFASSAELTSIEESIGKKHDPENALCFTSDGKRYFLVAGGFKVVRNQLDIFDSTLVYLGHEIEGRNVGEVLRIRKCDTLGFLDGYSITAAALF